MECSGLEERLENCNNSGIGVHDCDHTQDVGVQCDLGTYILSIIRKWFALQYCIPIYYIALIKSPYSTLKSNMQLL